MAYKGQLYQLFSSREKQPNAYFRIDGPYDTHGRVISSEKYGKQYLNLIRGVKTKDTMLDLSQF